MGGVHSSSAYSIRHVLLLLFQHFTYSSTMILLLTTTVVPLQKDQTFCTRSGLVAYLRYLYIIRIYDAGAGVGVRGRYDLTTEPHYSVRRSNKGLLTAVCDRTTHHQSSTSQQQQPYYWIKLFRPVLRGPLHLSVSAEPPPQPTHTHRKREGVQSGEHDSSSCRPPLPRGFRLLRWGRSFWCAPPEQRQRRRRFGRVISASNNISTSSIYLFSHQQQQQG